MLDRILYFLFRRKTGLILLGLSTIFFAMTFGGCFTLSMCACWHESCAEADCSDPDAKDCARNNAQYCNRMDKDYSCKDSGCDIFDCAFGYGCEKDCNNGTIDCGGCNRTCFTDCNNDCSGSTCNGCETCYYSFSNCKYEGNKTKKYDYYLSIKIEVVDESGKELATYTYNRNIETNDMYLDEHLKHTLELSELSERLEDISFSAYFDNALTFKAVSNSISFNEGQYDLDKSIDVTVDRTAWRRGTFYGEPTEFITIRATAKEKSKGNPVTITVDLSSAGGSSEKFTAFVGNVPQYNAPVFTNYELKGFYTLDNSDNEVAFDMTKAFSAYKYGLSGTDMKLTVYARYERKNYELKVIVITDGLTESETITTEIYHNETMADALARLSEEHGLGKDIDTAFFRWWSYDEDGNERIDESELVHKSKTVYCRYKKKLTLFLYDIDGKDTGTQSMIVGYGDEIGNQIELPKPADFERFKFVRWCTDENLSTGVSQGMPITEDNTTLYAEWIEKTEFNIRLFADKNSFISGTSLDEISFDYTVGTPLPDWNGIKNSVSAPVGYTFIGWKIINRSTDGDITIGTDIYTEIGENTLPPDDYSFVAEFVRSVTLIVKAAEGKFTDGQTSKTIEVYYYDETIITPTPVNDGYEFRGWSQTSSAPYDFVSDGENMSEAITSARLFAIFEKKQLSLTFVCDNGTPAEQIIKVTYGDSPADIPAEPTKTGYSFAGWFDDDGNKFDQSAAVTKETVYTAKFTPKKYTITLVVNGEEFRTVEVEYGSKVNLGVPSSGYFLFWYDGDNKQWTDSSGEMLEAYSTDGNVTLYARFL